MMTKACIVNLQSIVVVLMFLLIPRISSEPCLSVSDCQCTLNNGSVINLRPLSNNNLFPKFQFLDVTDKIAGNDTPSTPSLLFYDPCNLFQLWFPVSEKKHQCSDALGCLVFPSSNSSDVHAEVLVSSTSKVEFTNSSITYLSESVRKLIVNLQCNQDADTPTASVFNGTDGIIQLNLKSKCACSDGCKEIVPPKPDHGGLSTGSILLIILFTFLVIYIVGGILWNGVCQGASGLEMLPNVDFWRDFPSLIVEGANYSVTCCRPSSASYDRV